MTGMDERPAKVAEVLAEAFADRVTWGDGTEYIAVTDVPGILKPLLGEWQAEDEARALREVAKEARERGDIGKEGGCEAWDWLEIRAAQIGPCEACPFLACQGCKYQPSEGKR